MSKNSIYKELIIQYAQETCPIITKDDFLERYPDLSNSGFLSTIKRMIASQELLRPWKGVYIVSPKENFEGTVHLREYLDFIMSKCKRGYYVTLYDAIAELIPTYEIKDPSLYYVMVSDEGMSSREHGSTTPKLKHCYCNHFPKPYVYTRKTKFGKLNVATAELLAIDLISHSNTIGGLQESVRLLDVIKSKLNFRRLQEDIFEYKSIANVQRLGYIIENVLGKPAKAQPLYELLSKRCDFLQKKSLALGLPTDGCDFDKRWAILVNEELMK